MTDPLLCEAEHEQAELYAEPHSMPERVPWFAPVSFILGAVVMLFFAWGVAGWICDVDWGGWHG